MVQSCSGWSIAVVDGAKPFLKACYSLEGDEPLAFEVNDEILKM